LPGRPRYRAPVPPFDGTERDERPRTVDVPPALQKALAADPAARAAFEGMSFSHRREYAEWVAEAKRDETRDRRVARTLERLRGGRPRD
jgi:uncharacterized protein YdeI (YjbR/CyaY-like superfamily)